MHSLRSSSFLFALVLAATPHLATAQCSLLWSSGSPQPHLAGIARCSTLWDPDGSGPLPQRLVVGGDSLAAGDQPIDARVMSWDGTQWEAIGGTGPGTGTVEALISWNGELFAAGSFALNGYSRVARWSGTSWLPVGVNSGPFTTVSELTVWNGNLVAVTFPSTLGGTTVHLYDGATWTTLPTQLDLYVAHTVVSYQGLLCLGGATAALVTGALARWDGTHWLPTIYAEDAISTLAVRPTTMVGGSDVLYAGGWFTSIGPTPAAYIASTSGGTGTWTWSGIGSGLPGACRSLFVRNAGLLGYTLLASAHDQQLPVRKFTLSGTGSGTWSSVGTGSFSSMRYSAGTYFGTTTDGFDNACQRLDSSTWVPVRGAGLVGEVLAAARVGDDLMLGGTFMSDGGTTLNGIARWDGTTLQPIGSGMVGSSVDALLTLANGDVIAGGVFTAADAVTANDIARWNGTAWSPLGTGTNGQVLALAQMPNGDVIAAGKFSTAGGTSCSRIARWNGATWSPLGSGINGDVNALAVRADGTLFAGGAFSAAGGTSCSRIAQWNGSAWLPLGAGCNADVHGLAVRPNGDVVAVGSFTNAGGAAVVRCARWTGTAWASMGGSSGDTTPARAVCVLPDGDVVVGRGLHDTSLLDSGISRWNGSSWSGFGTGLRGYTPTSPVSVRTLALRANGDLAVGGAFAIADGAVARGLAKLFPTCPATATPNGVGCAGTGGPLLLTADTLPWIGATFRTKTANVPAGVPCVGVIGLTPLSIPIVQLLPQGQPGCSLFTTLDGFLTASYGPGTAHCEFALGDDPSLVGVTFYQQTIPIQIDGGGGIVAVSSSNALAATIGGL